MAGRARRLPFERALVAEQLQGGRQVAHSPGACAEAFCKGDLMQVKRCNALLLPTNKAACSGVSAGGLSADESQKLVEEMFRYACVILNNTIRLNWDAAAGR